MEPIVRNELLDLVDPVQDKTLRTDHTTGRVFSQAGECYRCLCRLSQAHLITQKTSRCDSRETVLQEPANTFHLVATGQNRNADVRSQGNQGLEGKREGIELYGTAGGWNYVG